MCSGFSAKRRDGRRGRCEGARRFISYARIVGDSSCLMLPHPDDKEEDFSEGNDTKYQRLAREHSPDDPLEAQRLVSGWV